MLSFFWTFLLRRNSRSFRKKSERYGCLSIFCGPVAALGNTKNRGRHGERTDPINKILLGGVRGRKSVFFFCTANQKFVVVVDFLSYSILPHRQTVFVPEEEEEQK